MPVNGQVRWGIVGTANIARRSFLPGLRAADGQPAAVAGHVGQQRFIHLLGPVPVGRRPVGDQVTLPS